MAVLMIAAVVSEDEPASAENSVKRLSAVTDGEAKRKRHQAIY